MVVSLSRRLDLMSGLGPTAEILSLRKPSLVFALRASLSAVQIPSRRICAWPKESIQRKGHPDAAYSLRSSLLTRVGRRGFPAPPPTCGIPAAPLRAILAKSSGARRGIRDKKSSRN